MSVWNSPCYSLEPLRIACNNLSNDCADKFPPELAGIADFTFGDCTIRHPERANTNAAEFYKANPKEWKKFFAASKPPKDAKHSIAFRNALLQANVKYAGIRAVYWCFAKFRTGAWKAPEKASAVDIVAFTKAAFELGAPATRANQASWNKYSEWISGPEGEPEAWAKAEEVADSVRYLWTLRASMRARTIWNRTSILIDNMLKARLKNVHASEDEQSHFDTFRYDTDTFRKKFKLVKERVKNNLPISKSDAVAVGLPYHTVYKAGSSDLVVFSIPGGIILYDTYERKSAILWRKDHERLVQMLQSDAKLIMYYSKYDMFEPNLCKNLIDGYNAIMKDVVSVMLKANDTDANRLCRAYDVCQYIVLANLGSDITDMALVTQMEKFRSEKLYEVCDLDNYMNIIDSGNFGVKEMLELAKFCKIFPCPDFCIHSVVDSVEKKSITGHKASDNVVLEASDGKTAIASSEELYLYAMRNRAFAFRAMHGHFPGKPREDMLSEIPPKLLAWPEVAVDYLTVDDMKYIDMKGTFVYRYYDGCEIELVKDKAIAPTRFKEIDEHKRLEEFTHVERNQVMKLLFDNSFMTQREIREKAIDGTLFDTYNQEIQLALKPEAKKPGSRAFSIASDEVRRLLSEAEANIAPYVKLQAGSSQGKSNVAITERMSNIASTPEVLLGRTTCVLSFDLEGFSPMQDPVFKERAMRSWSEVFDEPSFDATARIFKDTTLVFEKFGIKDSFKMVGNDLEGFHGRLNTAAHIDLMGYCVYKLKELGVAKGAASLEVLIDDGLMKIEVDGFGKGSRVLEAIRLIDEIYKFAGQKISWDKTFVSNVLCQYLNRVYYDGIEVTPGAKAFLRIGKQMDCAVPTLVDELMAHASTARGAIQSGAHHIVSYYAYMVEIAKSLMRWGMKLGDSAGTEKLAFALYIPIAMGGFGVSTLFGLSTNESHCAVQSGIAAMKMICFAFRKYVNMANAYLNAPMREMDTEALLRNPTAYRTSYRCFNTRRFANVAKSHILKNSTNTLIKAVNRGDFRGADDAILNEIESRKRICELQRKYLYDMTITSYIDTVVGKLQSSATAASLLGFKKIMVLNMANRSEAKAIIRDTMDGRLSLG